MTLPNKLAILQQNMFNTKGMKTKFSKLIYVLIASFFFNNVICIAQECKVQGIVRYKFNDYVGYKSDNGAQVYFVEKKAIDSSNVEIWKEYEALADKQTFHLLLMNESDGVVGEETVREFSKFSVADEKRLNEIDSQCLVYYIQWVGNASYVALVDDSGKYEVEIPFGEYYVIAKSANRERLTITELTGRALLQETNINKNVKIISFDFKY